MHTVAGVPTESTGAIMERPMSNNGYATNNDNNDDDDDFIQECRMPFIITILSSIIKNTYDHNLHKFDIKRRLFAATIRIMYRLLAFACFVALFQSGHFASRLWVNEDLMAECKAKNNEPLSNDLLLGEWFEVAKFTFFGGLVPSASCTNNVITKAVAENLTSYQQSYTGYTISMDDNPVMVNRGDGLFIWLLAGHTGAKDYFIEPGVYALTYTVHNYRMLTDDFMLVWDCNMRENTMWIHSRIQHPTEEEIKAVTAGVTELQRLEMQRFCAT